jgi:hypothetical protein
MSENAFLAVFFFPAVATAAQAETVAALASLDKHLSDIGSRIAVVEKILKEVE